MWRSFWVAVVSTYAHADPRLSGRLCLRGSARHLAHAACSWRSISPLLTSALVRTYAWLVILGGRRGILNQTLLSLGVIDQPLRILNTDVAVLIGMTQIHLPFMVLPLLAVLAERDRRLEEASLNLGASRTGTFFRVTVPVSDARPSSPASPWSSPSPTPTSSSRSFSAAATTRPWPSRSTSRPSSCSTGRAGRCSRRSCSPPASLFVCAIVAGRQPAQRAGPRCADEPPQAIPAACRPLRRRCARRGRRRSRCCCSSPRA